MKVECSNCGAVISKTPSQVARYKNQFCSVDCRDEHRKRRIVLRCAHCGKEFERIPSHIGNHGSVNSYCSKRCSELGRIIERDARTHSSWSAMHERCADTKNNNYGGRGISVCERWASFDSFLEDMGVRPNGMSIDRIDNNSGYSPSNCRWATSKEQARNTRANRVIEHSGEARTLMEWREILGFNYGTVWNRLNRGEDFGRAVSR